MKILHFFPYSIFFRDYYMGFINYKGDKEYCHCFYVYGNKQSQNDRGIILDDDERIAFSHDGCENLDKYMRWCDIMIINSIPENISIITNMNNLLRHSNCKIILSPWGREIFRQSDIYWFGNQSEIAKLDGEKKKLFERINYMVCQDKATNYVKDFFNVEVKSSWFNGLNTMGDYEYFDNRVFNRCNILVGHRGTITSGQISILERLARYKDRIDRIICPLSYGNPEYIKKVKAYGNSVFNDKFICIEEWMEKKKYLEYLNKNIDIAIFGSKTSEGMNTILHLCNNSKKVYINPENDIFAKLKAIGYPIREWNDEVIDFEEMFQPLNDCEVSKLKNVLIKFEREYSFNKWFDVFDEFYEDLEIY